MKKILIILLAIVVLGGAAGFYYYNMPVASLENTKPEVEVSAHKLLMDYEADEMKANDVYLGKVIEVKGEILAIVSEGGRRKIQLDAGSPMAAIICEIDSTNNIGQVKSGDEVKIKGLCSGYLSDVIVVQANVMR